MQPSLGVEETPNKPLNVNAYASDNASVNEKDKENETVSVNEDVYGKDNSNEKVNASASSSGESLKGVLVEERTSSETPSAGRTVISSFDSVSSETEAEAVSSLVTQGNRPAVDTLSRETELVSEQWSGLTEEDKTSIQRWLSSLTSAERERYGQIDLDPNLYKMDRLQRIIDEADLRHAAEIAENGPAFLAENLDEIEEATDEVFATKEDIISWWNFRYIDLDGILLEARESEVNGYSDQQN